VSIKIVKKSILLLVLFLLSKSVFGQDLLSFENCLELALKNNLLMQNAILTEEKAYFQYKASYGNMLPNILGTFDNKNSWGREIDPQTNLYVDNDLKYFAGNISANFNLFSGFSVINSIQLNHQGLKISKINIQKVKNEITIDLAQKYITILYLEEIILANKDQIKSSEKQLEIAMLKYSSGVISESEVFKIKSQKATEELNLLTNQNHLTDNFISLKQLMNISLDKELYLLKPNIELINYSLEKSDNQYLLTKKAVEINPSYLMSLWYEKKAKTALSIARAPLLPLLSMRLIYGSNYSIYNIPIPFNEQYNTNLYKGLRFNLIIPIFSQFDNFSRIKSSKLEIKQSKILTQNTQNELSKEVLKAITDSKTTLKKKEASTIAMEFSQKSYDADVLKFNMGKININELNLTKSILNNSQAELIQSKYELLFNNSLVKFYLGEPFSL
jgi:outer membrane protein